MATLDDIDAARQQYVQPAQSAPGATQAPQPVAQPTQSGGATLDDIDAARQTSLQRQNITPPPVTAPPPTATEAFKAGAEHYIRSSAPFQWAYTHLPALAEGDKAAGYTPLTEQQYQQRYGDSGFATAGSAAMGTLVAAPLAAGAELAAAPLAAYAAGGQLIRTAPQVIQTLPNGVQVLASQFIQRAANPLLQGAVRVGTNAVQGAIGAAATGGNLVSGAVGGTLGPLAGKALGYVGNSGALNYLANNKLVNAGLHGAGMLLGYEHGDLLGAAVGDRLASLVKQVGVPAANLLMRGVGAAAPYLAAPAGEAAGQIPVPGL